MGGPFLGRKGPPTAPYTKDFYFAPREFAPRLARPQTRGAANKSWDGPAGDSCLPEQLVEARCAFFFIGGVQPKTVELGQERRLCQACGLNTCQKVRQDYYLSMFFIPVVPVRRGEPYWQCGRCGQACGGQVQTTAQATPETPAATQPQASRRPGPAACRFCGGELKQGFKYCPYCGARINN